MKKNKGKIAYVTYDLGANDVDFCVPGGVLGFKAGKFKVAKVDTAFQTYAPFSQTTTLAGQTVPVAVAQICNLTWECTPAPVGPNIHANKAGYKLIAAEFRKALGL